MIRDGALVLADGSVFEGELIGAEADTPEIHDLYWLLEDIPDLLKADDRPEVSIRTRARFRRRDGSSIPVELFFSRMQFRGEAYVGGFIHDQSDQARIEHALQDTEQRLTALLDTSPDFIAVKDPQSRWQMANTAVFSALVDYPVGGL